MKIASLVIGGRGLIGSALVRALAERGHDYLYTTRQPLVPNLLPDNRARYLDLAQPNVSLREYLFETDLVTVYLIAGIPGVFECERNPDAWRINADSPRMLAYQAHARGWKVVFLSTGALEIAPHTAYAHQKAAVENVVLTLGGSIIRPRGRITVDNVQAFVNRMIEISGRPGVHWWEENI